MTPLVGPNNVGLLTDLYELTMASSYLRNDMNHEATFDLFIRELPERRNFLVSCGLDLALEYLEDLHFEAGDIAYLRTLDLFAEEFLSYLKEFSFTGEVRAIPEGEIVFAGEPLLQITAPLIEAQLVETFLLNCISFQTMVASKAARIRIACREKTFVDFSLRRDHGADAGLQAARASYITGAASTSNVLAGRLYGIPVSGTMAHSYVLSFDDELSAFRAYSSGFGNETILLIDTFDVEQGARNAVKVAQEAAVRGSSVRAVRIDSGDLGALTESVRSILDSANLPDVQIVLSGDLDEYRIDELLEASVPADSFGVGTQLGTSGDAPSLGAAYKLVHDERGPRMKLSTGKATIPGRKQVHRCERNGEAYDVIALEDEPEGGRPLLETVMVGGDRSDPPENLDEARARFDRALSDMPDRLKTLTPAADGWPVRLSPTLSDLMEKMKLASG